MNAQLETQDTEVRDICEEIGGTAEGAYDLLLERREAALAAAIEPLDSERRRLRRSLPVSKSPPGLSNCCCQPRHGKRKRSR